MKRLHVHLLAITGIALLAHYVEAFAPVSASTRIVVRPRTFLTLPLAVIGKVVDREESQKQVSSAQFDWYKAWYPLVPVEILDIERPHHFELLGQSLVVWNDGEVKGGRFGPKNGRAKGAKRTEGKWRAFVDECPHRKVPLSEGRIEDDGTLLCSYHAWRFD